MASELGSSHVPLGESKPASSSANSVDSFTKSQAAGMATTTTSAAQAKDIEANGGVLSEKNMTAHEGVVVPENEQPVSGLQSPPGDDYEYPTKWKLALITIALCLAVFCMALDNTIIATAIPRITDQFHALSDIGWYISVYLLTTCAFQLIFGKIYAYYSIKWVFMTALFIFELGSLICAVAPSSTALIFGRAIAGLGSAGIFTGAILIVSYTVPLASRPLYMGMIGGMYGIASVAGPLMGGAFTDNPHLTWRWCFYINLPFGGITALFLFLFFKSPHREKAMGKSFLQKLDQMDLPGTGFFMPGVVCLLLALQWGGSKYEWKSWRIILLLVFAGVLLTGFVILQVVRGEKSTVPPRVFKNRNIWGAATFAACLGAAFFVILYYVSLL
jgi:MFS family permease